MSSQAPVPLDRERLAAQAAANAARGRMLLHLDLAAALASDHVRTTFSDLFSIADWVVDVGPNGLEVLFFTRRDPPRAIFRVTFAADGRTIGDRLDDPPTLRQLAMMNARRAALVSGMVSHRVVYNSIVVPPPGDVLADVPIEVYLLRAATAPGEIVMGIHWHVLVSPESGHVLSGRALSRSDLTFPGSQSASANDILITEGLGEVPSEIYTYLSLKHDRPIEVVTFASNARWRIRADRTDLLGSLESTSPSAASARHIAPGPSAPRTPVP